MRVLMITQKLDPTDPLLAFTVGWVRVLAARLDHLDVLCLEQRVGAEALPANVTVWSMGKERGHNRLQEVAAFYSVLAKTIRRVDVIFCHMIPRFVLLAAPLARLFGKPMLLWYTHRQASAELKWALTQVQAVVSAVPESFPLPTPKLHPLGHGIDAEFYAPDPTCPPEYPPLILHVARLMEIKHQPTLLRALAELPDAQAALVGDVPSGQDQSYRDHLLRLIAELPLSERVRLTGNLEPGAVRDLYRRASIAVNLSPPGLFDKAALESMLCGIPTVVSSAAFDPVLGEYVELLRIAAPDDERGLVERLRKLLSLDEVERRTMSNSIRERVRAAHSLDGLMDRMVGVMESLR